MNAPAPRALIVEDDPAWQQILAELLEDHGFVLDLASDLNSAQEHIRAAAHRLAVVDLSLTGQHSNQDGLRVLNALRRHDPGCRAILLTGYATVELAVSALTEFNAFSFLRKENFQRAQFRDLVDRIRASAPQFPPLSVETASPPHLAPEPPAAAPAEMALVVDDDAGWRSILSELLTESGYAVRACASFGEALGEMRRADFHLAVIDLSLSGTGGDSPNGYEGFELLRLSSMADIPALVVSGTTSVESIRRAYEHPSVYAFIEKQTFARETFRRLVQEARTAQPRTQDDLSTLTEREREVLALLAQGQTNKEIAETLVITTNTVKRHLKAIFEKLGVHTRAAAAARAISAGLTPSG
ncbi:MAG: response regulator [Anaerolineales bacterium]